MNSNLENNLSHLPWTNTKLALKNLQELLKCNACEQLPTSPQYMGRCDHFFCEPCISKIDNNLCPICEIPCPPCDRKPDIVVRGLVSSVSEMLTLINGGKVQSKKSCIEAPEPVDAYQNYSSTSKTVNSARRSTNKENVSEGSNLELHKSISVPKLSNGSSETVIPMAKPPRAPKKASRDVQEKSKSFKPSSSTPALNSHQKIPTSPLPIQIKKNTELPPSPKPTLNAKSTKLPVNPPTPAINKLQIKTSTSTPALNSNKKTSPVSVQIQKVADTTLKTTPNAKSITKSASGVTPSTPAINKRNMRGETPLHIASIKRDLAKVKKLLEDGANPNTKDNAGWTPLHEACSHGFEDVARLLLEHGALVDVPGRDNMTPLHDAILTEAIPVISLLRRWGAGVDTRDIWGRTARSLAALTKCSEGILAALETAKEEKLVPKQSLGPLQNKIVVLDSSLTPEYKRKLERMSKLIKVKLVSEFSPDVTHLVAGCADNRKICQNTIKYMMAVVSGKWVITHKWIDACLCFGGPVNPSNYEVEGSTNKPCSLAPSKGRLIASKMVPGLFSGCHIYFCGPYGGDNLPPKKELEALVRAGDGIPLQREPNPEAIDISEQTVPYHSPSDGPLSKCSHFCVYVEGLNEPQLKYDMAHLKSLPLSWLYECIDNWCLALPKK